MSNKPPAPAIEGWYTMDTARPQLLGARCSACGTYYFPKHVAYCRNPGCESEEFEEVPLSRSGKIWSYTNACYQPPAPYVSPEPFQPFTIAAVELERERMIVLGQVISGVEIGDLKIGDAVELVLEPLHEDEESTRMVWKWRPAATGANA